jgi:hypothetical protein
MDGKRSGIYIFNKGFIDGKTRTGINHLIPWIAIGLLA